MTWDKSGCRKYMTDMRHEREKGIDDFCGTSQGTGYRIYVEKVRV